jgi:acyl-coenzyme A synthetase/AMP-(fatty) acid ligase
MTAQTLDALLQSAAQSRPSEPLVSDRTVSFTFEQVWDHTRRLSAVLDRLGVPPGARVAVVAERDARLVRLVLALMASGRVAVVLDPRGDEVGQRLSRVDCDLVLGRAPGVAGPHRSLQEIEALTAEVHPVDPPALRPSDLAYIIFTSGSTSTAKAVALSHGSLATAVQGWLEVYGVPAAGSGGALQFAGTGFDVFYGDLWRAVAGRYQLTICPDEVRLAPPALVELLRAARIDMVEMTPAIARFFLEEVESSGTRLAHLRQFTFGGEALRVRDVRRARRALPGCRILNTYGLVETTVDNFCYDAVDDELADQPDEALVPLGEPLPGCRYGIGGPDDAADEGELWIGGAHVAAGYVVDGRVDDTGFHVDGDPWFPTGDAVRRDVHGRVWYTGRISSTVKVHGERVDLEAVEAALVSHPSVAQAAAVLLDEVRGLVAAAYVPAGEGAAEAELRRLVADRLGPLAAPGVIHRQEVLPLSDNGKIDRRRLGDQLRASPAALPPSQRGHETGATPLDLVVELCVAEFGISDPDPDVPVGELGLGSLHVVRLLSQLGRRLGRRYGTEWVFSQPTLRRIAEASGREAVDGPPSPRAHSRHRLTPGQQELLLHDALHDDPAAYVIPWVVEVDGAVDPDVVEEAFQAVMAMHEPLRSHYQWSSEGWYAEPTDAVPVLERVDAGHGPTLEELASRPFDLSTELPVRAWWVCTPGADHAHLVIAMHHVASDGGTGQLVLDGLADALDALTHGRTPAIQPASPSFGDLAEMQAGVDDTAHLQYWRGVLEGFEPAADRQPPPRPGTRGKVVRAHLGTDLVADVLCLAREEACSPFAVLLTALVECERRWADSSDVLVGYPVSRRETAWTGSLAGLLIDTTVARFRHRAATGRDALRSTRQILQDNARHLGATCSAALRELSHGSGRPAFTTWLNWLGPPDRAPDIPGARTRMVDLDEAAAIFGRTLYVTDRGNNLEIRAVAPASWPPDLLQDQVEQVVRALTHLVRSPDRPLADADLVTPAAVTRVGSARGRAGVRLSRDKSLVAGAVGSPEGWLEGAALERAGLGRSQFSEPVADETVLLPMERTRDHVLDLVAALSRPGRVALWNSEYPESWKAEFVRSLKNLPPGRPGDREYVLPTSGTTGMPQPVVNDVFALLAVLDDYVQALAIGPEDRFVLLASLAHDPLMRDALVPLLVGGALFVPTSAQWHDPAQLLDVIAEQRATVLNLTPQLARLLTAAAGARTFSHVRAVVVAGDVFRPEDVAALRRMLPGAEVHHGYGLTETPQLPSLAALPDPCHEVLLAPGRPGSELRVLDAVGRPCALGQPGVIHVRSRYLASGLSLPLVQGEHDVDGLPSLRQLATGDRGELVGGGWLRYLGRVDDRVSVNGQLLDPGLVDAILTEDPRVADAGTEVVGFGAGEALASVVTLRRGGAADSIAVQLRQLVRRRLPRQYVPRFVLVAPRVPRTLNGKLDRPAIRRLASELGAGGATSGRVASTPTERALAAIWAIHLGQRAVPVDENFFDLGGTSLLLLRVHAAMRRQWRSCPAVVECYEHPTVTELAELIDRRETDGERESSPVGARRGRADRSDERDRRRRARQAFDPGDR